jgi:hypothetical protein
MSAFFSGKKKTENQKEKVKMKRSILALIVTVLALGVRAGYAGEGAADIAGIKISGGATLVLQGVLKANDGSDKGSAQASYSYDLELSKDFGNDSSAFAHIEGAAGEGLNDKLWLFSSLNGDAGSSANALEVTELWYEKGFADKKLTFTFGKIDPAAYFDANEAANSETEQFLAGMFVNNSAVALPDPNLGLRATYAPIESFELSYAYFNQNEEWNNIDTNGFNIIEAVYKLSDKGKYRVSYWTNNGGIANIKDGKRTLDYGIGLSADQSVSENVTLFARFGYRNPDADTAEIEYDENGDPLEFPSVAPQTSWSFGVQFKGSLWSRENDVVGVAFGQNMISKDIADAHNLKSDAETQAEAYYKFSASENIAFTPVVQYVSKPCGGNVSEDDVFTFGIRTQISF